MGPYCGDCGQEAKDPDPSLRELLGEAWDAFVSVDGRVLSSLRLLLFRPGALTEEYFRGHRTRFLTPLRLYLICSVAYFLVASLAPDRRAGGARMSISEAADSIDLLRQGRDSLDRAQKRLRRDSIDRVLLASHGIAVAPGPLDSASLSVADSIRTYEGAEKLTAAPAWMRRRLAHGARRVMRDRHNFTSDYQAQWPRVMFVLMPVFALLLALTYRSRHRRYPAHLVVSLHLHAFGFALLLVAAALDWLPGTLVPVTLDIAFLLWFVAYVPLALRRVYGGQLRYAVLRTGALAAEYSIVLLIAFSGLALGLLLVY